MNSRKEEFPPLWGAGFHPLGIDEVASRCVNDVPHSSTRSPLMAAFVEVLQRLVASGLSGDVWLDGSFVTEKIDPADIDFILVVDSAIYDGGSPEQRALMDALIDGCDWLPSVCDTNVAFIDPPERSNSSDVLAYWRKRFGYSSDGLVTKGIVVITMGAGAKMEGE